MKNPQPLLVLFFLCISKIIVAQETSENITFNDQKSETHGIFIGFNVAYGAINKEDTYIAGAKIAYIANDKVALGFAGNAFFTEQDFNPDLNPDGDIIGGYGGFYISPILYKNALINISFPVIIGAGAVGYTNKKLRDDDFYNDVAIRDNDYVLLVEPGIALSYNVSKYVQLEVLASYRLSSKIELEGSSLNNINGFSAGIGLKAGVFNF